MPKEAKCIELQLPAEVAGLRHELAITLVVRRGWKMSPEIVSDLTEFLAEGLDYLAGKKCEKSEVLSALARWLREWKFQPVFSGSIASVDLPNFAEPRSAKARRAGAQMTQPPFSNVLRLRSQNQPIEQMGAYATPARLVIRSLFATASQSEAKAA